MGRGNGGTVLVHVGINNAGKEGTTAIVEKCMNILKNMKQAMSSYQEFYQCLETGYKETEIRNGWH